MKKFLAVLFVLLLAIAGCGKTPAPSAPAEGDSAARSWPDARVKPGVEQPELYDKLLRGKRVGILTNQTGVDSNLRSTIDVLMDNYDVAAVCVPEHGLFGAVKAGDDVAGGAYRGVPVYSIYSSGSKRPSQELLSKFDVLVCDLQDVGARHYTYTSTLAYAMQECAKAKIPVVVFDRPNPLGGTMQGPVLKPEFSSFIGLYPLPLRHGLTIGEFAQMTNGKFMPEAGQEKCELHVIPVKGLTRNMLWQDTGLAWVNTSPLIPTAETALLYVLTGVIGDCGIQVGVGTAKPFFYVAAPYIDQIAFAEKLNSLKLKGVRFRPVGFTPRYGDKDLATCWGAEIYVTDPRAYNPCEIGYTIVRTLDEMYPGKLKFPPRWNGKGHTVDIAFGETSLRDGAPSAETFTRWKRECDAFAKDAQPYLLYK